MEIPEETWARWHLTDNLAMLRRCEEAIDMQKAFLAWADHVHRIIHLIDERIVQEAVA